MATIAETIALLRELLTEMGHSEPAAAMTADSTVKDLALDSLEMLEFLMLVDERTGVEVDADEATFETTIGAIAEMIVSRK